MPTRNWSNLMDVDNAFMEKVYAQVALIPVGRVCTYGKIAELIGLPRAAREVGIAMSRAKPVVGLPCHRVVNKNGTLAPEYAFGGQEEQRKLLVAEGVTFLPDGLINMPRHMWPEDPRGEQMSLL